MPIAREGYPFIGAGLGIAGVAWIVAISTGGWPYIVAGGVTVPAMLVILFFRDPDRETPMDDRLLLAPADGRIVEIGEVEERTFFGGRRRRVSIFLSIFNVHVQRAPMSAMVMHRSYSPGHFALAWKPAASLENEHASLGLRSGKGEVMVRQIAGLAARRIVTYPGEGERIVQGERIGLIRFGSRVDLYLPLDWPLLCARGDRLRGGLTPVAEIARPEEGDSSGRARVGR